MYDKIKLINFIKKLKVKFEIIYSWLTIKLKIFILSAF